MDDETKGLKKRMISLLERTLHQPNVPSESQRELEDALKNLQSSLKKR